jgi:hypothetical protein
MPLKDIVQLVEREQNVTVVFNQSCSAAVPESVVDAGTHSGKDVSSFLRSVQLRTRPPVKFHVISSGPNHERHEIVCN